MTRPLLWGGLALGLLAACAPRSRPFVVGSRPGTESETVAELAAVLLEGGSARVERKSCPNASSCFNSVKVGDIDAFVEQPEVALTVLLGEDPRSTPEETLSRVQDEFLRRWGIRWLEPMGWRSGYVLAMRRSQSGQLGLERISQLKDPARKLRCGFDSEFADRMDGYKALAGTAQMDFCSSVIQMSPQALHQALLDGRVDLIDGRAMDGLREDPETAALEDDGGFFPRGRPAFMLSAGAARKTPSAPERLSALSARLGEAQLRRLALEAGPGRKPVREAAESFLRSERLLP